MKIEEIIGLGFVLLVFILIASAGVFSDIIVAFSETMGGYGVVLGVIIVLIIILGIWQSIMGNKK